MGGRRQAVQLWAEGKLSERAASNEPSGRDVPARCGGKSRHRGTRPQPHLPASAAGLISLACLCLVIAEPFVVGRLVAAQWRTAAVPL